jgi:hypothetical protein
VRTGKPAGESSVDRSKESGAPSNIDAAIGIIGFSGDHSRSNQDGDKTDMKDKRKRNKLLRHESKAHMLVGKRNGLWIVTVFTAEHTHPMVKQLGRRRYYHPHRKLSKEDFQFLQTLHNQDICTAKIMGCLGSVNGGDPRCLPFVKKDVSNIHTML